jgi:hypothetical protein
MPVLVWAAFIILTVIEAYIIFRLAKRKEAALIKNVVIAYLLFTAYFITAHFGRLRVPEAVMILAMASLAVHTLPGYYFRLYGSSKKFDRGSHALACFSYSMVAYFSLTSLFSEAIPPLLAAIIIASMGITLGVFVEIIEFALDSRKHIDIKLQKGLRDTNFDLISDVIGSALAGAFACLALL